MATRKIVSVSLALALGVGAVGFLSACSPQQLVENAVENAVQDATGGDVNFDVGTDGSVSMPADFPSAVPTVSGDLISAVTLGSDAQKSWTIVIKVADPGSAYGEAKSMLEGAGFTATMDMSSDGNNTGVFDNGTYSVMVFSDAGSGDGPVLSYTVSQTSQ